jgi:hypothetical protein
LSLAGSFHFDDYSLLSGNIWRVMGTRPLTGLTFCLSLVAGDRNPLDYHAIDLALHLIASLLLFDVLRRLVSARAAFIGAIVFAIHPIQSEAVNYVFARATELDTVLCLAALLAWLRERPWWTVAWFAAGLMAKEECAAFPVFLFFFGWSLGKLKGRMAALLVMAAIAVAAGVGVYIAVLRNAGVPAGPHAGITPVDYFLAQGPVILRYLRLLAVPWGFNVDAQIAVPPPWLGLAAWAVIGAMVVVASRWFSEVRAGFWFIAGLVLLLPSSSIFPVEDLAADRRMYLPMIAFAACAGVLLERVKPAAVAAVAVVLIGLSVERTLVWRTEQSLWSDAMEKSPEKVRTKIQLARVSDPARALALLQQAESRAPEDSRIPTEMGRIYLANGNAAQALSEFGRALALNPRSADALNNRGAALLALGQTDAARQDFERALVINPCQPNARENLAHMGIEKRAPQGCE